MTSRKERLEEFMRRMTASEPRSTFDDAYELLCDTLNEVEDELSGVPYNPDMWSTDGRLYPPQPDSFRKDCKDHPSVVRLRTRGHNIFIAQNGAIEIQKLNGEGVIFQKPGADGKGVWA
jgi:hypothetical protein